MADKAHGTSISSRARAVQAAMLPSAPSVPGLAIAAEYRACEQVGGDFYDFVVVDSWHLGIAVADVSGHGTAAALVMAAAKKSLQQVARGNPAPREVLVALNDSLLREIPRGMFVSALYAVVDIRTRRCRFVRAGHAPLLLRRGDQVTTHKPEGTVLGVLPGAALAPMLAETVLELQPGDDLLLFTDGVTEAVNPDREMFGETRLRQALAHAASDPGAAPLDLLRARLDGFRRGAAQHDDEALVLVRVGRPPAELAPLSGGAGGHESNLPPGGARLVGRETELADLLSRLTAARPGLITITGTAGIGKSRLAVAAAGLALSHYPAGAWHADLSDARDENAVCAALAKALGVEISGDDAAQRLGFALKGRALSRGGRLLVLLDGGDQCLAPLAALVKRWREAAPDVTWLLTSRAPPGAGESVLALRPLPVPARKATGIVQSVDEATLRQLAAVPSVALFVARAAERDGGFVLNADNADAVGQLCVRLDGIPLAIELAAARARVLPPAKMLERIKQRFALLRDQRDGGRNATLRGAIAWSWDLLEPHERAALAQLSVFRGGFFLEHAEQVVDLSAWPDAPLCVDVIESLRDKSLLDSADVPELAGERRFFLYESIRAFAAEMLDPALQPAVARRWRDCLMDYARAWWERRHSAQARAGRKRLALELDGLVEIARHADDDAGAWAAVYAAEALDHQGAGRVALELIQARLPAARGVLRHWLIVRRSDCLFRTDPVAAEAQLAEVPPDSPARFEATLALVRSLHTRGKAPQLIAECTRVLELPGLTQRQRAEAEDWLATAITLQGRYDEADALFERALVVARREGDRYFEGNIIGHRAVVHFYRGNPAAAEQCFRQAHEAAREAGDHAGEVHWLSNRGLAVMSQLRYDEARALIDRALTLGREQGNRAAEAVNLNNLATISSVRGDREGALKFYEQAYALDVELDNTRGQAMRIANMATILREMEQLDRSLELQARARAMYEQIGDRLGMAVQSGNLGVFMRDLALRDNDPGRLKESERLLRECIDTHAALGTARKLNFEMELGWTLLRQGRRAEAAKLADGVQQALDTGARLSAPVIESLQRLRRELAELPPG
jgi:predicted ATPase/Tfp pilus assembly protein PilF